MNIGEHPMDPQVLWLGTRADSMQTEWDQLGIACRFYGFDLVSERDLRSAPVLVIVHGAWAGRLPASEWIAWMNQAQSFGVPVCILGLIDGLPGALLRAVGIAASPVPVPMSGDVVVRVATDDLHGIGSEFADIDLPAGPAANVGLALPPDGVSRTLAYLANGVRETTALVRFASDRTPRYLMVRTAAADPATNTEWQFRWARFGELLPYLLLVRDVGGDRCWRSCAPMANLTIDDPWLIEPYGALSFPGLLAEMCRVGFHATIGFVPWNYDRSARDVVRLLAQNPRYFSLAVHGNNHDRYEFYRYRNERGDRHRAKTFAQQEFNIRQAVARMNAFRRSTGLEYDRVMVFPHGICPAPTLRLLKDNGFWATANFRNVPLGHPSPSDPAVLLRTVHTDCEGFPAMRRLYPQNYTDAPIATDLFLGNPILFMAHQDLFAEGIEAFDDVARRVNRRQPAVRWAGLGEISRHVHRMRRTGSAAFEVRMSSCHAKVQNPSGAPAEFVFFKEEPRDEAIESVTIDGRPVPWTREPNGVRFRTLFPPNATAVAIIGYAARTEVDGVEVRRGGLRNRTLRIAADFRDLAMSRSKYGRRLIAWAQRSKTAAIPGGPKPVRPVP